MFGRYVTETRKPWTTPDHAAHRQTGFRKDLVVAYSRSQSYVNFHFDARQVVAPGTSTGAHDFRLGTLLVELKPARTLRSCPPVGGMHGAELIQGQMWLTPQGRTSYMPHGFSHNGPHGGLVATGGDVRVLALTLHSIKLRLLGATLMRRVRGS